MRLSVKDFEPVRLRAARQKVVQAHPSTAEQWAAPAESTLRALRQRVEAAGGSPDRLQQLAWSLTPREIRWLVTGLEQWNDLRDVVGLLLRERARPSLTPVLWLAWQRRPLLAEIAELLAEIGDTFGWESVAGPAYAKRAREWVLADAPGHAIQAWLDGQGLSYSDAPEIAEFPLRLDSPLLRLVRDAVLMFGSTAQLRTEGNARIGGWLRELSPEDRFRFGQNYLLRLPSAEWDASILVELERSYGLPRNPRVARFWQPIPEGVRRAFQRFFIQRKLRRVLGDDDRYEYWVKWVDEMIDVKFGTAGSTPYGVFDFETFGVVEFFEYGNAAYLYPPKMLARITGGWVSHPSDLKRVEHYHGNSNRLIHNSDWYYRADVLMRRWMRATRAKPHG